MTEIRLTKYTWLFSYSRICKCTECILVMYGFVSKFLYISKITIPYIDISVYYKNTNFRILVIYGLAWIPPYMKNSVFSPYIKNIRNPVHFRIPTHFSQCIMLQNTNWTIHSYCVKVIKWKGIMTLYIFYMWILSGIMYHLLQNVNMLLLYILEDCHI